MSLLIVVAQHYNQFPARVNSYPPKSWLSTCLYQEPDGVAINEVLQILYI